MNISKIKYPILFSQKLHQIEDTQKRRTIEQYFPLIITSGTLLFAMMNKSLHSALVKQSLRKPCILFITMEDVGILTNMIVLLYIENLREIVST